MFRKKDTEKQRQALLKKQYEYNQLLAQQTEFLKRAQATAITRPVVVQWLEDDYLPGVLEMKYEDNKPFDRVITAKYTGRCSGCGKGFRAGDQIRWVKNKDDTKPHAYCLDPQTCKSHLIPASLLPENIQATIALALQNGDTDEALRLKKEAEDKAKEDKEQSEVEEIEALLREM